MRRRTCCGIPARRTWLRTVRTCARCRRYWATPISPPRRCTRIWRWTGCGRSIRNIIRGRRRSVWQFDNRLCRKRKPSCEKAVADFLRHLRERNASPHTIKAYTGISRTSLPTPALADGSRSTTSRSADFFRSFMKKVWARLRSRGRWPRCGRSIGGWRRKAWSSRIRRSLWRRRSCRRNFRACRPSKK